MKWLIAMLSVVLLLLLSAALAPLFRDDPGLVTIRFLDWTVETSVLVLLLGVVLLWGVVQLALWMWRAPARTARRVRRKRELDNLEKGLLALTEGDWRSAERALSRSASAPGKTTARYLAAAEAAHGQDASERRDLYLEHASDEGGRRQRFLVELTRARMLVDNDQLAEAIPLLEALRKRRPKHPQVLELLARSHRAQEDWDALSGLLPALSKAGVLDEHDADRLGVEIAAGTLAKAPDGVSLHQLYKRLPRSMRERHEVLLAFATAAERVGEPERAEPILRRALSHNWSGELVLRYANPASPDASKRLQHCEEWLSEYPEDAALHLAMGRLCAGGELWGKAREHFVRSLELQPSILGFESFGQLLERQGELETAMACFRNALRLSQGREPVPLPSPLPRVGTAQKGSNG
ncbi:MAG: heme biosynthesis HemY N-terminal domain-containing protein [Xanthomonadales bacterium]|nr:heme biosynthesis HemY N-terminal domain-containing protein [Xanthomonadales bacterium]